MLPRFSTLFGLGCCLLARAAWADTPALDQPSAEHVCDKSIARQHFDAATRLLEQGKRREAIAAFEAAYECRPHFAVLYNISQAYVQLREFAAARKYLERYLKEGQGQIAAEQLATAREQRRLLEEAAPGAADVPQNSEAFGSQETKPLPGSLRVRCGVPGAHIVVDGQVLASSPFERSIPTSNGHHVIEFAKYGFRSARESLEVASGQALEVTCRLRANVTQSTRVGRLRVVGAPKRASIILNGETWQSAAPVPIGSHSLVVRDGSVVLASQIVSVRENEVVTFPLKAAEPGALSDTGSGGTKIPVLTYALGGLGVVIAGAALGVHAWNQGRFEDWRDADVKLIAAREEPWSASEASLWNERQRSNNRLSGSIEATNTTILALSLGAVLAASGAVYFALDDAASQVSLRADGVALHLVW